MTTASAQGEQAGALLARLRARFARAGVDAPGRDARVLLGRVLGCGAAHLHAHPEKVVPQTVLAHLESLARRRIAREPLAYLTGEREFWSLPFLVSPAVLIPRPDTELLVARAAALLREARTPRVVDVGTGSGAVGLSVARELPGAAVFLSDVCPKALRVAARNAQGLGLAERVRLVASDLLCAFAPGEKFDLIASNPPYVASAEIERLMPEVAAFEPRLALDGGADGMRLIRRLLGEAPAHLASGGVLLVEMDPRQMAQAEDFSARGGEWRSVRRRCDLAGRERVLELVRA